MAEATAAYDVVIIGGGPGGYNAAIRAGQLGLKVACVEMRSTLGGTCLNVGCMPSKALLHASELWNAANTEFAKIGIEVQPKLHLDQMHKAKDDSVTALTKGIEFLMKKNKVDVVKGFGRIAGAGKVEHHGALPLGEGFVFDAHGDVQVAFPVGAEPGVRVDVNVGEHAVEGEVFGQGWEPDLAGFFGSGGEPGYHEVEGGFVGFWCHSRHF